MKQRICEGKCEKHRGAIQRVRVVDPRDDHDWGEFWYCEEAIATDEAEGFRVEDVNP